MFFINNNQPEVYKWKEQRAPRTKNEFQLSRFYFIPELRPFIVIKLRMVNADIPSEVQLQSSDKLCRKRNFGKEIQHLLPAVNELFDLLNIQLCFSAACDPMQ